MALPQATIVAQRYFLSLAIPALVASGLLGIFAFILSMGAFGSLQDILNGETTRTVCSGFATCNDVTLSSLAWKNGAIASGLIGASILLAGLGLRKRITYYESGSQTIFLTWGRRLPLVYASYSSSTWVAFAVQKKLFFTVYATSHGYQARSPRVRFLLQGMTKSLRIVTLGDFHSLTDAEIWRRTFTKATIAEGHDMPLTLSLPQDGIEDMIWKSDPFFSTHPDARRLYQAMGKTGNWEHYGAKGGFHYDQPDPYTLEQSRFDIPFLASMSSVTKPWSALAQLIDGGWIAQSAKEDVKLGVELEQRLPWINASVLRYAKKRMEPNNVK